MVQDGPKSSGDVGEAELEMILRTRLGLRFQRHLCGCCGCQELGDNQHCSLMTLRAQMATSLLHVPVKQLTPQEKVSGGLPPNVNEMSSVGIECCNCL